MINYFRVALGVLPSIDLTNSKILYSIFDGTFTVDFSIFLMSRVRKHAAMLNKDIITICDLICENVPY